MSTEIDEALATVKAAGYIVLREKSYRQAQERQRIADTMREYAVEQMKSHEQWAQSICAEERRVRERLTFVYGVARAHGATVVELTQPCGVRSLGGFICTLPGGHDGNHIDLRVGPNVTWSNARGGA